MTTQYDLSDQAAVANTPVIPRRKGVIYRDELRDSYEKCHKIEDAIWSELTQLGCDEQSKALQIDQALEQIHCPTWCEQEAWERIAESYRTWSTIFGNLQLFRQLRRKRDD